MTPTAPAESSPRLTGIQWLICIIAVIGFAFDSYVLLMLPLILRPGARTAGRIDLRQPGVRSLARPDVLRAPRYAVGSLECLGGYLTDPFGSAKNTHLEHSALCTFGAWFGFSQPSLPDVARAEDDDIRRRLR